MSGVYVIHCKPTGELYVGGTKMEFAVRFSRHRQWLRQGGKSKSAGGSTKLLAAWLKWGEDAFEFIPLKEFPPEQVAEREWQAIERLKPTLNIYTTNAKKLAAEAGLTLSTIYARAQRGLTGEDLVAPKQRAPRKPYTRK